LKSLSRQDKKLPSHPSAITKPVILQLNLHLLLRLNRILECERVAFSIPNEPYKTKGEANSGDAKHELAKRW